MDDWVKAGGEEAWSRRRFLLQTAKFSALAFLGYPLILAELPVLATVPDPKSNHILLLGDWGADSEPMQQIAVANAMKRWASDNSIRPDALFMLGDNFCGEMPDGINSHRWIKQFEQMYPSSLFPGPVYAVLGDHDYETSRGDKVEAELAYTRQSARWTMPRRWYSVKIPKKNPLLTLVCLDSNIPGSKGHELSPWSSVLTGRQHDEQQQWLEAELAKPRTTPFVAVAAHHPLYSNGQHRDNPKLIAQWDSLLRRHNVDLYFSGHDHDLQHLEFEGHPTSFVISGGGGAELVGRTTQPQGRVPWGRHALGFTDLQISKEEVVVRHIGKDATILYEFKKPIDIMERS